MGRKDIEIDKSRLKLIATEAVESMRARQGLFGNGIIRPEADLVRVATEVGGPTLARSILFWSTGLEKGDNTSRSMRRLVDYDLINTYKWLFNPLEVVIANKNRVDVGGAAKSFYRPAGYGGAFINNWVHNSKALYKKFGGSVEGYFQYYGYDASEIVKRLVVRPRAKTREKRDIRGYGPKIARLAIQNIGVYYPKLLTNINEIGIPVDFQISRVLIQTGAVKLRQPENAHNVTTAILEAVTELTDGQTEILPREISESIWGIGHRGCNNLDHANCPLAESCRMLISRKTYDKGGMFVPEDVGRFRTQ